MAVWIFSSRFRYMKVYHAPNPDHPTIYWRGQIAEAEPAVSITPHTLPPPHPIVSQLSRNDSPTLPVVALHSIATSARCTHLLARALALHPCTAAVS
jgi:hypothetical protein